MSLDEHIKESKDLSNWLSTQVDDLAIVGDLRDRLSAAALNVALDHHVGLIILLEHRCYSSFMALLRPQMDAWANGAWLNLCATEEQLNDFAAGKNHAQPAQIFSAVEKALDSDVVGKIKSGRWRQMCDFTHTGILQLQRNLTSDRIEKNYPEEELCNGMDQANACAMLAATLIAGLADNIEIANGLVERAADVAARIAARTATPGEGVAA